MASHSISEIIFAINAFKQSKPPAWTVSFQSCYFHSFVNAGDLRCFLISGWVRQLQGYLCSTPMRIKGRMKNLIHMDEAGRTEDKELN